MQARYRVQWLRRMRGVLFLAALSLCALPLLSACSDEGVVASRVKKDSVDVRTAKVTVTGATVSLSLPGRVVAVREAQIPVSRGKKEQVLARLSSYAAGMDTGGEG